MADALPSRCACISDFNLVNFGALLENDPGAPPMSASLAPFNQVPQTLADPAAPIWSDHPDFALVWTRPEGAIRAFERVRRFENVAPEHVLDEVDAFMNAVRSAAARVRALFLPTWTIPSWVRGLGPADLRDPSGVRSMLARMNARLCERAAESPNVYPLDAARWCAGPGRLACNPKLWHMAKVPFANDVFREAVRDIKAAVNALHGRTRKVIVLDLDDTLWGGILGDAGWQNLALGGHDPEGESFREFQCALLAMLNRGILLAIASKNDESAALEAIRSLPEMVLRPESFAAWRINWLDKARNIADLAAELNVGLDSLVFIDDNPVERARVREALPDVLVPEWPSDSAHYAMALAELTCFDAPGISAEDRARSSMYRLQAERQSLLADVGSVEDWLRSLGTVVRVEALAPRNLQRAAQLLNKTNQLNLSTRRMTESELLAWSAGERRRFWTFTVADRFGDSGLTGLLSLEWNRERARIIDFVLSCRVMGRRIEEAMVAIAVQCAAELDVPQLLATYLQTPKNQPCLDFWRRSGFEQRGDDFIWPLPRPYPTPDAISVILADVSPTTPAPAGFPEPSEVIP